MLGASLLFATMGVCVKLASALYPPGEIVFYRGLVGMLFAALIARSRGSSLRTDVPAMHFWRSLCGVLSLGLWFYAIGGLPLGTAVTLNYLSSVWMALFLLGGAVLLGAAQVDGRLVAAVLVGFGGVALVLRPAIGQDQLWHGLAGLLSGMTAALAYLQVTTLGRRGEPETRIVFYFALGGVLAGALSMAFTGLSAHDWHGAGLLLAVGLTATAGQLLITRAYAIGSTLANAGLQYTGCRGRCSPACC
jgi:drug/metabolite transporter (DMT)-like permease